MNKKLLSILALCTSVAVSDSFGQNRDRGDDRLQDRGRSGGLPGAPQGGDRGGRGGFGGGRGGDMRGGRPSMMSILPVLVALDANKDGEISSKELDNAAAALRTLDKNGDGKLTEDEVRPSRPPGGGSRPGGFGGRGGEMRGGPGGQQGRGFGGRGGEGGGGRPDGGGRPNPAQMVERLMAFDKNGDGKLGKDELSERMQGMIARADTDGDGFVTKEELTKLANQAGGGRRGGEGGFGGRPDGRRGGSESTGTTKPRRPEFDN